MCNLMLASSVNCHFVICQRILLCFFGSAGDIIVNHTGFTVAIITPRVCVCVCVQKFACAEAGEEGCIAESAGGLGVGFTSGFRGLEGIKCCPNIILTYRPGQTNRHTPDQAVGQ